MEGTFMTGVDVGGYPSNISQLPEVKSSLIEKTPMPAVLKNSANKSTRLNTAKPLQPIKNESLPQLQQVISAFLRFSEQIFRVKKW